MQHIPVLHKEVEKLLDPKSGEVVIDATVGLGGHAKLFAQRVCPEGRVIGLDADEDNLSEAKKNLNESGNCVELHHINFREIESLKLDGVDIIFADLGLSSPHVDDSSRGFSYREDGPLDLRFDRASGATAAELIKSLKEEELADVLWRYGELSNSRKIARAIKEAGEIRTTFELKDCLAHHFLPIVFQALRIAVNDELGSLEILLHEGPKLLKSGGRMGVISFHSLEDRMVKQAFKTLTTPQIDPVTGQDVTQAQFELITKKPIVPSKEEVSENPRARSAKFRILRKR